MFIRSPNLFMRPFWPEDREAVLALIGQRVPDDLSLPWPMTAKARDDETLPRFLIQLMEAGNATLIGSIGLGRVEGEIGIGCWISPVHRGHGYAAEAIGAVAELAQALGHERVVARRFSDSNAAGEVLLLTGPRPGLDRPRRFARVDTGTAALAA